MPNQLTKKQIFDLQFKYPELIEEFGDKWWEKERITFLGTPMWTAISEYEYLSEEFIQEFKDFVDWDSISYANKVITEDFIREFQDRINWKFLSRAHYLSEDFIKEFQDKVDWSEILINQKLSSDFITEISKKVDWDTLKSDSKEILIINAINQMGKKG